jgi:hypothetical protein
MKNKTFLVAFIIITILLVIIIWNGNYFNNPVHKDENISKNVEIINRFFTEGLPSYEKIELKLANAVKEKKGVTRNWHVKKTKASFVIEDVISLCISKKIDDKNNFKTSDLEGFYNTFRSGSKRSEATDLYPEINKAIYHDSWKIRMECEKPLNRCIKNNLKKEFNFSDEMLEAIEANNSSVILNDKYEYGFRLKYQDSYSKSYVECVDKIMSEQ